MQYADDSGERAFGGTKWLKPAVVGMEHSSTCILLYLPKGFVHFPPPWQSTPSEIFFNLARSITEGSMSAVLRKEQAPFHARMLIGGEWTSGTQRIEVFNPARPDELVGTVARGVPDDVERAIAAAKAAQPAWASKTYSERARIIAPVLERLAGDIDARTVLYVRENGKTASEARAELSGVPSRQRFTLDLATELDRQHEFDAPNGRSFVGYLPFGVVVSIVPWNAPVSLAFLQIVPALLAGNTIVV
jgi:delta 1-pyrroline-5-carboxylate dehydrogenase